MDWTVTALMYIWPIMLAWVMLSACYWYCVRPFLHDCIVFHIYRARDKARLLAIDGKVSSTSFSYNYLEEGLCIAAYNSPRLTLLGFAMFLRKKEAHQPTPEMVRFREKAPDELKAIQHEAVVVAMMMMLVNSPLLALIGLVYAAVSSLRKHLYVSVERFFEQDIVRDGMPRTPKKRMPHTVNA